VPVAPPTYPDGFPAKVVFRLQECTGHRFCCNRPYDGIGVISDYGEHHLSTGELILYTSQDSVLQVAGHHDVIGQGELHEACSVIRAEMRGEHEVSRVIARPFTGRPGAFERSPGRRDYSVAPPGPTVLDALGESGISVHAVGKIGDLFAGRGITVHHPAQGNAEAMSVTSALLSEFDEGLVFTNLIDTDQEFGHRKDVEGFHAALQEIDANVAGWLALLRDSDLLILTADHGCDPAAPHSDHTREYVPLLAAGPGVAPHRHDGAMSDVGATVLRRLAGRTEFGQAFA